jgi:tRNA threonylcarbamoyladenosine biosynthesis protein TsaB
VIVLGFDTATSATAVGLRLADGTTFETYDYPAPGERPGHATRLLPLADQLLTKAGLEWDSLQRIAVGVGPGTFTGLRVGIATARGLAQSLSLDLVSVSSLHALARHALREGRRGPVLAAIDARRGEVFAGGWSAAGELFTPRALAPDDLGDLLHHQGQGSALEHHDWLALGDGAIRFRSHFEDLGVEVPADSSPSHRIDGASICELALDAEPSAPDAVLPNYLRRPDAEIALQGAAG